MQRYSHGFQSTLVSFQLYKEFGLKAQIRPSHYLVSYLGIDYSIGGAKVLDA